MQLNELVVVWGFSWGFCCFCARVSSFLLGKLVLIFKLAAALFHRAQGRLNAPPAAAEGAEQHAEARLDGARFEELLAALRLGSSPAGPFAEGVVAQNGVGDDVGRPKSSPQGVHVAIRLRQPFCHSARWPARVVVLPAAPRFSSSSSGCERWLQLEDVLREQVRDARAGRVPLQLQCRCAEPCQLAPAARLHLQHAPEVSRRRRNLRPRIQSRCFRRQTSFSR
jgi:hypothetical protein